MVLATQSFDSNLNFGTNDPHPYGVGYTDSPSDVEYVFNEDRSSMPTTTYYFNLLIFLSWVEVPSQLSPHTDAMPSALSEVDDRPSGLGYDDLRVLGTGSALLLRRCCSVGKVPLSRYGGVAQLVERLTGSQEVRGFEPHRLHRNVQVTGPFLNGVGISQPILPHIFPTSSDPANTASPSSVV